MSEKNSSGGGITINDNSPLPNAALGDQLGGKTVEDVKHKGQKPNKGSDILAKARAALGRAKSAALPSRLASAKQYLSASQAEVLPVARELGEQAGKFLQETDFVYLKEQYSGLVEAVSALVADTRSTSSAAAMDVAAHYLSAAWSASPKNVWAIAKLTEDANTLGMAEEVDGKPFIYLPLPKEHGGFRGAKVRWLKHSHLTGMIHEMASVNDANLKARDDANAEKERELWSKAQTRDLLAAIAKGESTTIAFRIPPREFKGEKKGGCKVALVALKNGALYPLDAVGADGWHFQKGKEQGISLPLKALSESRLSIPGPRLENQAFQTACRIWEGLQRAVEKAKENAKFFAELDLWTDDNETVSPEEFAMGKTGKTVAGRGLWKLADRKTRKVNYFSRIWLLVEREKSGNIAVVSAFEKGDGIRFIEQDSRMVQFYPPDQLVEPFRTFYKVWSDRVLQGQQSDEDGDEPKASEVPENGAELAKTRQAEADAELEAARAKVAALEAQRIAAQETEIEAAVDTLPTE